MERDDWHLLKRYYNGECSPEEIAHVPAMFTTAAGREIFSEVLRAVDLRTGLSPELRDSAAAYARFERMLAESNAARSGSGSQALPPYTHKHGIFSSRFLSKKGLGRQLLPPWAWPIVAVAVAMIVLISRVHGTREHLTTRTYATGVGQQATLLLDDGTHVTLAPRTTLRLVEFGSRSRTVELEGQAFFDVVQSAKAPFLVRTGTVITRVLGTAFMVRHYERQAPVHVSVIDGKIHITSPTMRHGVTLAAGTIGDIADTTAEVHAVDELVPGAEWQRGKLIFHHTSVASILQTLGRWYGYRFRCADSVLAQQKFTMVVNMQSAPVALATLEEILGVNLAVVGDTVTLTAPRARPASGTPRGRAYDVWTPLREVGR